MIRVTKITVMAFLATGVVLTVIAGCASSPPKNIENVCSIFKDKKGWYKKSYKTFKKWGVPVHVQMAIIYQESRFRAKAKPPRKKFLGFIPTFRPSSAYGYAQVKDSTWDWYLDKTGRWSADRAEFGDAVDFIGWYTDVSHKSLGISKWDARNQYLAYHEGHGGYKRKTYRKKSWLVQVAGKVGANAKRYQSQLSRCEDDLDKGWSLWPF